MKGAWIRSLKAFDAHMWGTCDQRASENMEKSFSQATKSDSSCGLGFWSLVPAPSPSAGPGASLHGTEDRKH